MQYIPSTDTCNTVAAITLDQLYVTLWASCYVNCYILI
jgi:hypothetical protein